MAILLPFYTERLHVADWSDDLASPPRYQTLLTDLHTILTPEVLAPLPPSLAVVPGPDAIADWVRARRVESQVATIRSRQTEALVGLLILASFEGSGEAQAHIGYLFAQASWGMGYGSEMLAGLVRNRGSVQLLAGVSTDNLGSVRVLEKAGFKRDEAGLLKGMLLYKYLG